MSKDFKPTKIGKGKSFMGCTIHASTAKLIEERAKLLGMTKSSYLTAVINWWLSCDCPPVALNEEIILQAKRIVSPAPLPEHLKTKKD